MKKKIFTGALAVMLAAIVIGGATLAYFSDTKTANNTFTVGNVKIELVEEKWNDPENGGAIQAEHMYPGEAVPKDPVVINKGKNPCMVRIKVEMPTDVTVTYRTNYKNDELGEDWKDGEDGYFYYMKPLEKVDDETTALFDQIVLSTETGNDFSGKAYDVKVTAEAVQAQGIFASYSTITDGITPEEFKIIQEFFATALA